jgi:hypothetical protein
MQVTYENSAGEEVTVTLPTKKCVCHDCNGEGFTLRGGMRGHAYTAEEFYESFDEEDREEYFRPGGKYDEVCNTCKGKNVVDEIDEDACKTPELKEALEAYDDQQEQEAAYRREEEAERRMGC